MTLKELIDRRYSLTRTLLTKNFREMTEDELKAELELVNEQIDIVRKTGERNVLLEAVEDKYSLTKTLLSKNFNEMSQDELKAKLKRVRAQIYGTETKDSSTNSMIDILKALRTALKENKNNKNVETVEVAVKSR